MNLISLLYTIQSIQKSGIDFSLQLLTMSGITNEFTEQLRNSIIIKKEQISHDYLHSTILHIGAQLGYYSDGDLSMRIGTCLGFSVKWMEACLLHEEAQFNERVQVIINKPPSIEQVEHVKEKIKFGSHLLKEDSELLEVLSFYESIRLYQDPYPLTELFNKSLSQRHITSISPFASSDKIIEQGGLAKVYTEAWVFTDDEVMNYFSTLAEKIKAIYKDTDHRIGFTLNNIAHAIGMSYDVGHDTWTLMDINTWPPKKFESCDIHAIAACLRKSFKVAKDDGPLVFSTQAFTTANDPLIHSLRNGLEEVKQQHVVTNALVKSKEIDYLLFISIQVDDSERIADMARLGVNMNKPIEITSTLCEMRKKFLTLNKSKNPISNLQAALMHNRAILTFGCDLNEPVIILTPTSMAAGLGSLRVISELIKLGLDFTKDSIQFFDKPDIHELAELSKGINLSDYLPRIPIDMINTANKEDLEVIIKSGGGFGAFLTGRSPKEIKHLLYLFKDKTMVFDEFRATLASANKEGKGLVQIVNLPIEQRDFLLNEFSDLFCEMLNPSNELKNLTHTMGRTSEFEYERDESYVYMPASIGSLHAINELINLGMDFTKASIKFSEYDIHELAELSKNLDLRDTLSKVPFDKLSKASKEDLEILMKSENGLHVFLTGRPSQETNRILHLLKDRTTIFDELLATITTAEDMNNFLVGIMNLPIEQRDFFSNIVKVQIPIIMESGLNFGRMLTHLKPEDRTTVISIKRLMDSLKHLASDSDIRTFASALMSDDDEKIHRQLTHLIGNTKSSTKMIDALTALEPRWQTRITKLFEVEAGVANQNSETNKMKQSMKAAMKELRNENKKEDKKTVGSQTRPF